MKIPPGSFDSDCRIVITKNGQERHVTLDELLAVFLAADNVFTGTNEFDGATNFDGTVDFDGAVNIDGAFTVTTSASLAGASISAPLILAGRSTLTIASGVITVTGSFHYVDTEGAAATDNLDTITAGSDGQLLVLRTAASARDVTLRDGVGNLSLAGDCVLDNANDTVLLMYSTGGSVWLELSRSSNA